MQSREKNNNSSFESAFLQQLLFKYLPYWPVFVGLLVVSLLLGFLYIKYKQPVYESTAALLIKDQQNDLGNSNILDDLNFFGSKKIVDNEIEILHSRTLMQEVVKNLHLYAPVSIDRKIVDHSAYMKSPVVVELNQPDSLIETDENVHFKYLPGQKKIVIDGEQYVINEWLHTPWGDMRFLPNKYYRPTDRKYDYFFRLISVRKVSEGLRKAIDISATSRQSTVIDLKLKDPVPQRSNDILNNLLQMYNKAAIDDKNTLAGNTLHFINERLSLVATELDSVENNIQAYKTKEGIVDLSSQGEQYLQNVSLNDQQLSQVNVQLAVLDQVEKYVTKKSDEAGIVPSTFGIDNDELSSLLEKLYDQELEYTRLKKTVAENNPMLVSLHNAIEKIKPDILQNIRNERQNLEAGQRNLNSTSDKYASILKTIPKKERQLLEISRKQEIENNIYTFLLQKREETALSFNSTVADSRLVDSAEASIKPVSPKPLLVYLLAAGAAFVIGIGFISFKELLNQTIVYRSEIEQYTSVPVVAEVAHESSGEGVVIENGKRTFIAEQFRHLRSVLAYLGINGSKKKILVTSSIPGEGKSFVSANLGVSLALTGKKVVLLELDLRKPMLSNILNVKSGVGLTNYLINEKEADYIIRRSEDIENLFVIPCGPIPPNPSELLLNGKLDELINYLEGIFDSIIIDSPPINAVTDTSILAHNADATLYIVKHNYTPRLYVQRLTENIKLQGLQNVAIVFNGVKARGVAGGKYGYGYGYSYGYGYGDDGPSKSKKKKKKLPGNVL